MRLLAPRFHAFALSSLLLGCASSAAIRDGSVSPDARAPKTAERVPLPAGAKAVAVFARGGGEGIIALADGRFLAVDARGEVHPIDRIPGERAQPGELPVASFWPRGPDEAIAMVPAGILALDRGVVHREPLAPFLRAPRAFAPLGGGDALWATADGVYANYTNQWFALEAPAGAGTLGDVSQIVPLAFRNAKPGARDAWIRTGSKLLRVHLEPAQGAGASPAITWIDPAPGVPLGAVHDIARVDPAGGAVVSDRGVTLVGEESIRTFHEDPAAGLPAALSGGGGWAWVAWNGRILRTNGETWESVGSVAPGPGTRIAADEGTGAFALVLDGAGGVTRIQVEDALFTSGLASGATVFDTKVDLEILPAGSHIARVTFALDGKELATRTAPPWGWGEDGARSLELSSLGLGNHQVDIRARIDGTPQELARTIRFTYGSPIGRVPGYEADIAPLYDARCGRCHSGGVASDLSSYERLSAQARQVRASIREARMPPDLKLDPVSAALFTTWVDGRTPR